MTLRQNSWLWPSHLGWPCMAWLIASLSYASPFTMTRLWSLKGIWSSVVFQLLNRVQFFATAWTTAHQASLSFTIPSDPRPLSQSCYVTIFCSATSFSFAFNLSQHQCVFWVSSSHQWPKYCSFSISPPSEYSGLISFSIDWLDLFAVQGTLKSLLQQWSLVCHIKFLWSLLQSLTHI